MHLCRGTGDHHFWIFFFKKICSCFKYGFPKGHFLGPLSHRWIDVCLILNEELVRFNGNESNPPSPNAGVARVQSAEASHKLVDPVIIIYDNLSSMIKTGADGFSTLGWVWIRVWRIYSNIRIFLIRIFIRTFVRIIFCIRIYSDIRSYQNFVTNIFGYSFVSKFWYEYIRIFVRFFYEYIRIFLHIPFANDMYISINSYPFLTLG